MIDLSTATTPDGWKASVALDEGPQAEKAAAQAADSVKTMLQR